MIFGDFLKEETIINKKPIEIIIYTKLNQSILNEALYIINENGGAEKLKLYLNKLKRDVTLFIRSADSGGGSAGNVSIHLDSPTIKIKGESSEIGGGNSGVPILIPNSNNQSPIVTIDLNKKYLKNLNNKYEEVFIFVSNNRKILTDIWFCTKSEEFRDLIKKLLINNTPQLHY